MAPSRVWSGMPPDWCGGTFHRIAPSGRILAGGDYAAVTQSLADRHAQSIADREDCMHRSPAAADTRAFATLTLFDVMDAYDLATVTMPPICAALDGTYHEFACDGTAWRFVFAVPPGTAPTDDPVETPKARIVVGAVDVSGRRIHPAPLPIVTLSPDQIAEVWALVDAVPGIDAAPDVTSDAVGHDVAEGVPMVGLPDIAAYNGAGAVTGALPHTMGNDAGDVAQFLADLWRGGHYATIAYRAHTGGPPDHDHFAIDPDAIAVAPGAVLAASPSHPWTRPRTEYYFRMVCPVTPDDRKATNAAVVNCVWLDFDLPPDMRHDDATRAASIAMIRALAIRPPTYVVDSGGGAHCYWVLGEPFVLHDDHDMVTHHLRERFVGALKAWRNAHAAALQPHNVKVDAAPCNLAAILRVPGTFNHKRDAERPTPVRIVACDRSATYAIDDLVAAAADHGGAMAPRPASPAPAPDRPASPAPAPRTAPPPKPLGASVGWRAKQSAAVDAQRARHATTKLQTIITRMSAAVAGERHAERLRMGRLAGGLVAMGAYDLDTMTRIVYDALPPQANVRGEVQTIIDAITHGASQPFDPSDLPVPPTTKDPVMRGTTPHCPDCDARLRRSKYAYPGDDELAWWCPDCGGAMQWPNVAMHPGAYGDAPDTKPVRLDDAAIAPPPARFAWKPRSHWRNLPQPTWLLDGFLQRSGYHMVYGQQGTYKTAFILDLVTQAMVREYATGRPFRVFYLGTEEEVSLARRVEAYQRVHPDHADMVEQTFYQFSPDPARIDFVVAADFEELVTMTNAACDEADADALIVVIDTLRMAYLGDENDSQLGAIINRHCQDLIRRIRGKPAVIIAHHEGHAAGKPRGTTAVHDNVSVAMRLTVDPDDRRRLTVTRPRAGKLTISPPPPTTYEVAYVDAPLTPDDVDADGTVLPLHWCTFTPTAPRTGGGGRPWRVAPAEHAVIMKLATSPKPMTRSELGVHDNVLKGLRVKRDTRPAIIEEAGIGAHGAIQWRLSDAGTDYANNPFGDAG